MRVKTGFGIPKASGVATLIGCALMCLNVQAADLLQIYKEALANDPVYASARAAMQAGEEKLAQGRSGLLPGIGVTGNYLSNGLNEFAPNGVLISQGILTTFSTHFPTSSYTVSLTQPLFRMANWHQYEIGKLSAASTEAQFAQAREDMMLRVAQAYFDVLSAQDALGSIQANKVAITEQLASAKRNFEVGTTTITDSNEAQSRYDLAVAQELAAQNDLEIRRTALQQIIGKPAGELAPLRAGVKLKLPEPARMDQWVDSAEHENFSVVGQQIGVEIAQRTIKANRAGHYPTLDFIAQRVHTNQGGSNILLPEGVNTQTTVGVQWNIPIFSGFMVDSKVREAIALEDKAQQDLENARRSAAQAARQSFLGVSSGLAQVAAYEAAELSSQSSLDSNLLGYQVGVRINIDVLNAQQQLYSTRQALAKARYDTIVNGLRLKSAAGSLKEDDLLAANGLLSHSAETRVAPSGMGAPVPDGATIEKPLTAVAVGANANSIESRKVLQTVNEWAIAWSARDVKKYFSFYADDFQPPDRQSRQAWESMRLVRIADKSSIAISVVAPTVRFSEGKAIVVFKQRYSADSVNQADKKTLLLVKYGDDWKIVQERLGN